MDMRVKESKCNDNLWKMACKAQESLDETKYPQMKKSLNRFLVMGDENPDYMILLGCLEAADIGKKFPKIVGKLVVAIYEYVMENEPDPTFINNFASLYYNGRLGKKDYEMAMTYYEMADKAGCTIATENVACMYYYGFGTEIDYALAYKYFSRAALRGRYGAMAKIGDMYRYGLYVEPDPAMVFKCYTKALSMVKTDTEEMNPCFGCILYRVADAYYEGIGVQPSLELAMENYQKAELALYEQIKGGDKFHYDKIKYVVDRQQEIREKLQEGLPTMEY